MNRRRVFLLLPLLFVFLPSVADAASISRPVNGLGLVGYWSFNEGTSTIAGDFSGYGNAGALQNGPTWVAGKRGAALNFTGSTDIVSIANPSNLPAINGAQTVSLWYRVNTNPAGNQAIVTLRNAGGTAGNQVTFGGGNLRITRWGGLVFHTITAPAAGQWHHVAWSTDGADGVMYVDGVQVDTDTVTLQSGTVGQVYFSTYNGSSEGYAGRLDEVRIYNRALSATEIAAMYTAGTARINSSRTAVTNGLVAHWTFDGANISDKIYDRIGGSNGYVFGGATSTTMGKIGQALNMPGSNNMAAITASANIPAIDAPQSLSFWYWANSNAVGDTQDIVTLRTTAAGSGYGVGITGAAVLRVVKWGGSVMQTIAAPAVRTWHHVVWTFDGTDGVMYLDNVQVDTDPVTPQTGTVGLVYFSTYDQADNDFIGKLDDVRVYNRAITAAEVEQIYNEAAGTKVNVNTVNDSTLDQGLISYWSFNGPDVIDQVYDRIGGNNGYFYGTATSTAKKIGKVGQAFNFNSTTDSVEIAHNANQLPADGLTFSVWMKPNSHGNNSRGRIIDKSTGTQAQGGYTLFTTNSGGDGQIGFAINNSSAIQSGAGSYALGQWVHVAATATAAGASIIYINGVQATTGNTAALSGLTTTNALSIGKRSAASDRYFDGILDEVRMYSRVLTAAEVKQLYNAGR